jgi:hypothetical protein
MGRFNFKKLSVIPSYSNVLSMNFLLLKLCVIITYVTQASKCLQVELKFKLMDIRELNTAHKGGTVSQLSKDNLFNKQCQLGVTHLEGDKLRI